MMNIHFFRNNELEKIDFDTVIEFFESMPNYEVFITDEYIEIEHKDPEFCFEYRFLITKKSRVSKIYKLNPMYSNINFLLEMPILIPSFLAKEILDVMLKLCRTFELGIYHDSFNDVKAFNVVEFLDFFQRQRANYIQENGYQDKIRYDNEKFQVICKFQRAVDDLIDYYHNEVIVNYCYPIVEKSGTKNGICYDWKIGTPAIFAPYVDYVNVIDDENENMLVRRDELFIILKKYLISIKNYLPDMYIIKDRSSKKARREIKKIKKIILDIDYKVLRMCDVIEG